MWALEAWSLCVVWWSVGRSVGSGKICNANISDLQSNFYVIAALIDCQRFPLDEQS